MSLRNSNAVTAVKLSHFPDASTEKEVRPKYVLVSSLHELKTKGAIAHGIIGECEIVTECGTPIDDDAVLFHLLEEKISVYVKPLGRLDETSRNSDEEITENEPITPLIVIESESSLEAETEIQEDVSGEIQEENMQNEIPPEVSADNNKSDDSSSVAHYPVDKILSEMRQTVRGDSAETIGQRLLSTEFCEERDRSLIIKATGTWLMNNTKSSKQYCPTSVEYVRMAQSIVKYYPSTENPNKNRPKWELFYDGTTNRGPLEYYVRNKRLRCNLTVKRQPKRKHADTGTGSTPTTSSREDILAAEKYMRETILDAPGKRDNNREEMLLKFKLTRDSRREFVIAKNASITVLNKYPRLKDMPEAIDDEFFHLKQSTAETFVQTWVEIEKNIVAHGKRVLKTKAASQLLEKIALCEANYDTVNYTKLTFELLLHLLPNNVPAGRKSRTPTPESWPVLYYSFNRVVLPAEAAEKAESMLLLGILDMNAGDLGR